MKRIERNGIVFYQFDNLSAYPEVVHGVFTRIGGVSPSPFDSLNVGGGVGDDRDNVRTNGERIAQVMGFRSKDTRQTWQWHDNKIILIENRKPQSKEDPPRGDGIVTSLRGLPLTLRFADCVPILFYDPREHVVGLSHAGWKGTVKKVAAETIYKMSNQFGCKPENIIAAIGPAIGPCCYEVGQEVISDLKDSLGKIDGFIHPPVGSSKNPHIDLWGLNRRILESVGVQKIEVAEMCTAHYKYNGRREFFSYRLEKKTGQFSVLIGLQWRSPLQKLMAVLGGG